MGGAPRVEHGLEAVDEVEGGVLCRVRLRTVDGASVGGAGTGDGRPREEVGGRRWVARRLHHDGGAVGAATAVARGRDGALGLLEQDAGCGAQRPVPWASRTD
jgi:hypothetical protein